MKSFTEFKGYQTRTFYDAEQKCFTNVAVKHPFLNDEKNLDQADEFVSTSGLLTKAEFEEHYGIAA